MAIHQSTSTIAFRDRTGAWFVLTPELQAQAQATLEQAVALEQRFSACAAGRLTAANGQRIPVYSTGSFMGVVTLPLGRAPAGGLAGVQRSNREATEAQ